jgi:hypothetical protein
MTKQIDLHDTDPITGIDVRLPDHCRCGASLAIIGAGAGPHCASLRCEVCDTHRGWVSRDSYNFLISIIEKFGRPTEPVLIRRGEVRQ